MTFETDSKAGACSKISYSITSSAASHGTSSWPLGDIDGQRSPELLLAALFGARNFFGWTRIIQAHSVYIA
jgi:hypothetical protein